MAELLQIEQTMFPKAHKEAYRRLCEQRDDIPLFLQAWWLDAVTEPDNKQWQVLLSTNKKGEIEGALPFVFGKKFGMYFAVTPQLTQYTGIWQRKPDMNIQKDLIHQLEALHLSFFEIRFRPEYTNWLPFYWSGYKQQTRYTYRIEDTSDLQNVISGFDSAKKKHLKHIESNGLQADFTMSAEDFYELQCLQLKGRKDTNVLSNQLVTHLVQTARKRDSGEIICIKDREGNINAASFVVWDNRSAYNLITAIHPDFRSSGASTMMIMEALKICNIRHLAWDFEGSMIENVEHNNRQFGAVQQPYFEIFKYSPMIQFAQLFMKVK